MNPLLRRLATLEVRDISIATLEIEDVFLGYYEAPAPLAARGGTAMMTAFRLELRRGRMLVLWVGLVAIVYAGGITLFYPTILENAAQFEKLLEVYPKQLMAAFGIQGSLGDQGTFLNSYVFQFMWPLVAAILAILLATRLAADAETRVPGPAPLDAPATAALSRVVDRGPGRRDHRPRPDDDRGRHGGGPRSSPPTSRPTG